MSKFDIIVIGDGFAARTILAALDKKYRVLQVFCPNLFPKASASAGALASSFGAREGLSKLGDLNVASFRSFQRYIQKLGLPFRPKEMSYFFDFQNAEDREKQRFLSRWGEENISKNNRYWYAKDQAYLIDPALYLECLKNIYVNSIQSLEGRVDSYHNNEVLLYDGSKYTGNFIIDCTGAYGDDKQHKIAFGAYFRVPYCFNKEDFLLNLNGKNILYHHQQEQLIIGATTQDDKNMVANLTTMLSWQSEVDQLFNELNMPVVNWKAVGIITGLRSKAQKRIPNFSWRDSVFTVFGLYKNGLMYSVKALDELSIKLRLDSKIQL